MCWFAHVKRQAWTWCQWPLDGESGDDSCMGKNMISDQIILANMQVDVVCFPIFTEHVGCTILVPYPTQLKLLRYRTKL